MSTDAARAKGLGALAQTIEESGFQEQHWLLSKDESGWGCDKCAWTGATIEDFWMVHGRGDDVAPF